MGPEKPVVPVSRILAHLAEQNRVILLGGLAIIAHGLERSTKDADAWLEPYETPDTWARQVIKTTASLPNLTFLQIATWQPFPAEELSARISEDRVVRIVGSDRPLDLFREPNQLPLEDFDEIWNAATELKDGVRLPSDIHLLISKEDTGRPHDLLDIEFLQKKAEDRLIPKAKCASPLHLQSIFEQFLTRRIAEAALENPHPEARSLALTQLHTLAQAGDPFAQELIDNLSSPKS